MPRTTPLPKREREICNRLRLYREGVKASRGEFAIAVKLDSNTLAAIEYGRRPLRIEAASAILRACRLSPKWLATGIGPDEIFFEGPLTPEELGVSPRALFSEVFDSHLAARVNEFQEAYMQRPIVKYGAISVSTDLEGRAEAANWVQRECERWFAKVPAANLNEFLNAVCHHAKQLLDTYPHEPSDTVTKRKKAIMAKVARFASWQAHLREKRGEL